MTRDEILDDIRNILERFNPEGKELHPQMELVTELNIDSVAAMDVIMEIEDKFDIDVPVNQIAELRRIDDLVAMVESQRKDV